MQWTAIAQNWQAYVGSIMQRWPEAEEDDLLTLDGTQTTLAGYLAGRTNRDLVEINEEIEEWRTGAMPSDVRMDESRDNHNIGESARHIPPGEDVYNDDDAFGAEEAQDTPLGRTG
ncbi:hypothetical protein [Pseudooceanicola aestuarii]|uniref:hypothetical protein n=1 Tax=Pseudooceanicola aestuarii TaxID=2697319 RepID=UPI0013D6CE2A|nr:hypothetical protein [Pseudooceanicola aestuarii]